MLYETHMHTPLCKHAFGSPYDYAMVAKARGLAGITITCHNPLPDGIAPKIRMSEEEWPVYLDLVAHTRQLAAPQVDVRLGLEADYLPGLENYLEKQLGSASFDYVLGSVHWHMPEWQHRFWLSDSIRQLYAAYFEQLAVAAETGLFDCLAHPDLVKNVSPSRWSFEDNQHMIEPALDRIAATGVALELNTSGRLKSVAEFNPGLGMLKLMKERDIPVVVGSDAHSAERVGEGFEEALREVGYGEVSLFEKRQRYTLTIDEAMGCLRQPQVAGSM